MYSGTDVCGNAISQTCTVSVTGAGPATITCPVVTITCDEAPGFVPGAATFTGACGNNGSVNGTVQTPFNGCTTTALSVLYSGSEVCGNAISQTCTVTVTGAGPAIITCPVVNITCDEAPGFVPGAATFTGACGNNGSVNGTVQTPFNGCTTTALSVLYSGTDVCGNAINQTCTVSVTGAGPATITCPVVNITCDEAPGFVPGAATFTGACGNNGSVNGVITTPFAGCSSGTIGILYSGTDVCGNTITQACSVNVSGTGPAVITCPIVNITCDEALGFVPSAASFAGACNNNGSVNGVISTPFNGCTSGTIGVTYSGTDICGNAISQACTVTVTGAGPAVITCPVVNIECDEAPGFIPGPATFSGACGNSGSLSGTITSPYSGCGAGTIGVTYSGVDNCGNNLSQVCTVNVSGAGGAIVTCPVTNIECDDAIGFVPGAATFSGACGNNGTVNGTITTPYDGCGSGTIVVTYSGVDNCGNSISQLCTINVSGGGAAIIACPAVTIGCEEAGAFVPGAATFSGACGNNGTLNGIISTPFNGCTSGTIGVTYSGLDNCGNNLSQVCTVDVIGAGPASITCPVIPVISCTELPGFVPPVASFSGACNNTGSINGTITATNSGCNGGTLTVAYNGTDNCGNQLNIVCDFTIAPCGTGQDIVDNQMTCPGVPFVWSVDGMTYTMEGTFTTQQTDANGCTFNQTLILTYFPVAMDETTVDFECEGTPYFWPVNGETYTETILVVVEEEDDNGCIVRQILDLTFIPLGQDIVTNESFCSGGSFTWPVNGVTYTTPGTFTEPSQNECGGTFVLNLGMYPVTPDQSSTETICQGDSFFWPVSGEVLTIADTYSVEQTDANGCTFTISLILVVNDALVCSTTSTGAGCEGTGTATVTTTGGAGNYTYLWNDPLNQTTPVATGLVAGDYTVVVSDPNGCTTECSVTVVGSSGLTCTTTSTPTRCGEMGNATVTTTGGTGIYTYLWSNGDVTPVISGLQAGLFTVTVTDSEGCSTICSVEVTADSVPTCTTVSSPATCGEANGTATVTAMGGAGGYTYLWSDDDAQMTPVAIGLAPGLYSVIVTDQSGCSTTCTIEVEGTPAPECAVSSTPADCGSAIGTATVTASSGTQPYTYLWSTGQTTPTITGLIPGVYMVTVRDARGCETMCVATVGSTGDSPQCTITSSDVTCGDSNGVATANATGGIPPYSYLWSANAMSQTTQVINDLDAGMYSVTVTDSAGCDVVCTTMIESIGGPSCTTSVVDAECGVNSGAVFASAAGGTGPYSYLWNTGATSPTISGLAPGPYSVTVTDEKGCQTVCQAVVLTSGANCGEVGNLVWNDLNGDGIYDPTNEPGLPGVTVTLFDAETGEAITSMITGPDGSYCFVGLPAGDYYVGYDISAYPGFVATQATGQPGGSSVTGDFGANTTDEFTLIGGQNNKDVDAAFYMGGSIGNTVWCDDTEGPFGLRNILDSGDTRVPGVEVRLYSVNLLTGVEMLVATTFTDAEGSYLFSELPLGEYQVEFFINDDKFFVSSNAGSDDNIDGDVITERIDNGMRIGRTMTFRLTASEINLTIDAGTSTEQPLSIELLSFDGVWNSESLMSNLFWSTSLEINSDYIAVERTRDLAEEFTEIGRVKAQGNSSDVTPYTFDDDQVFESGIYYYRLRLVDIGGSVSYSEEIALIARLGDSKQDVSFGVYPNPVIEKLNIDINVERASDIEIGIYDVIGQLIQPLEVTRIDGGKTTITVNVSDVPVGAYVIRLDIDGQVHFEKVSIIE